MTKIEVNDAYKLKKKDNNGFIYSVYWWVGFKLAYFFKFIRISPNQVSILSLIFYLGAGYLFLQSENTLNIIGGILFYLGVQMDATDGKLARLTGKTSKLGIWLDYNFDYLRPLFIYPPIGMSLFFQSHNVLWILLSFLALCAIYVFTIISMRWDMFDFSEKLKNDYMNKSKYHKFLKEFYFYEGIEPLVLIVSACLGLIELYLIIWTAWLVLMYLISTTLWGVEIYRRDVIDKQ